MPRRGRRRGADRREAGDPDLVGRALGGPGWAQVEGFEVRSSTGDKPYRCPYCQGSVAPRSAHLVVLPAGRPEERRHYHTSCWARQNGLRRP